MPFTWTGSVAVTVEGNPDAVVPGAPVNPIATSSVTSIKGKALRWTGTETELVDTGIEFFFWTDETETVPKSMPAGHAIDGVAIMLSGGEAAWVTATPAPATDANGLALHGAEFNPVRTNSTGAGGGDHGWDGRSSSYRPWLNRSGGVWMRPQNVLTKVKSRTSAPPGQHWCRFDAVSHLVCLKFAPEGNELVQVTRGANQRVPLLQIPFTPPETYPAYTISGGNKPTVAIAVHRLGAFNPAIGRIRDVVVRRTMSPRETFYPTDVDAVANLDNYGQTLCQHMSPLFTMLCDAAFSKTEKDAILLGAASRFMENYWPFHFSSAFASADGAVSSGWEAFMAFGALATGRTDVLATMPTRMGGNVYTQTLEITSGLKAKIWEPHTETPSKEWPSFTQEQAITNVAGNVITLTFFPYLQGGTRRAISANGNQIVRVSDGASALVTDVDLTAGTVTIDAQPGTPFATGNVIYFRFTPEPVIGDAVWSLRGTLGYVTNNASTGYRDQQRWLHAVLAMKAFGILPHEPAWRYALLAQQANFPATGNDWPPSALNGALANGGGYDTAFLSAHEAALEAIPFAY